VVVEGFMSKSLNRVSLLGNLGRDAEVKSTQSGISVANLNIATTRRVKKGDDWQDETEWHRVTLWRCENIAQYLTKGTRVMVEGRLQTRSYGEGDAKRFVTEVVAEDVILLGGNDSRPPSGSGNGNRSEGRKGTQTKASGNFDDFDRSAVVTDEDVPF
jgi:single-strand DNA-binding protein